MNNVVIKGRLAFPDPEMEITNSGKKVCRIQVAVHRRFQKGGRRLFPGGCLGKERGIDLQLLPQRPGNPNPRRYHAKQPL